MLMTFETLLTERKNGRLYLTFNRPDARNALSYKMVDELHQLLDECKRDTSLRMLIIRGSSGWFCAGGDLKEFLAAGELPKETIVKNNRAIGALLKKFNELPQVVIMMLEGAAIGGGFGLTCVSDIAIATADTRFALSETSLGIPPAQITPFVLARLGQTQMRRLALTASRFKGEEAERLGLIHYVVLDSEALLEKTESIVAQIERCSPAANAISKHLMRVMPTMSLDDSLDYGAEQFAKALLAQMVAKV